MNAPVSFSEAETLTRTRLSPVLWIAGILSAAMLFWLDLLNFKDGIVVGGA